MKYQIANSRVGKILFRRKKNMQGPPRNKWVWGMEKRADGQRLKLHKSRRGWAGQGKASPEYAESSDITNPDYAQITEYHKSGI